MSDPILIINPNSSGEVTDGIRHAVAVLGPHFEVIDIQQSPATIASDEDVARAGLEVLATSRARPDASAYITACFSDPGLDLLRAEGVKTAIGCQEAGILTALARADRFGIIALSERSIPRHMRKMRQMGVAERLAGELALPGVSAAASGRDEAVYALVRDKAEKLGQMGAGAIVLGCAGMAPIRARLEQDTGLAVIDPVMAAASIALGAVLG
ncbi:aspartate/glutamate racemase family protein [Donghicola sp.]|jgi:Asp/Glu/hydantoin racemase|uniref:aspartate/glutamate racemase family protein n=1 Tax=Donghicola sp. TaxID=1929294 RepID=UPI0025D75A2D|nr:aspartate/glutamate racemase family protein [Donghicola sp.]MCT4577083.1 aspartate/glutamate racemase family protein [Donghicola sp.]